MTMQIKLEPGAGRSSGALDRDPQPGPIGLSDRELEMVSAAGGKGGICGDWDGPRPPLLPKPK